MRFFMMLIGFFISFSVQALQLTEVKMTPENQTVVMKFLYPTSQFAKTEENRIQSFWTLPPALKARFKQVSEGKNVTHVISEFHQAFVLDKKLDKKNERYVVILLNNSLRGTDFDDAAEQVCKSCIGIVGLAVINLTNGYPQLIAYEPVAATLGSGGSLAAAKILQIGPERYGFLFNTVTPVGMGYVVEYFTLVDLALKQEILSTESGKDLQFLCDLEKSKNCNKYHYHSRVKIQTHLPVQFGRYPIQIEKKGMNYNELTDKAFPYHVREQYYFNGKKYVLKK